MPKRISASLCVRCKGVRKLCGKHICPILLRFKASVRALSKIRIEGDNTVFGSTPPTFIVGEGGYPEVNVYSGIAPHEDPRIYDDPENWWGRFSLEKIVELRSSLLLPKMKQRITIAKYFKVSSFYELQLAAISRKPVDTEAKLEKQPLPILRFDGYLAPLGPTAPLRHIRVIDNVKIERIIEKTINDYDLKASDAVIILYNNGLSIYEIIRIFSTGLLGRRLERKLVPTRWAITATDVILGNMLIKKLRNYPSINEVLVYNVTYLGNHFEIILIPGVYSFEMIESWLPQTVWTGDIKSPFIVENYELWNGKLRGEMDGGYYALRLGILENLCKMKRQASIIAIREISSNYYAPVGNWHIRESARQAFHRKPEKFNNIQEALKTVKSRLKTDLKQIICRSILLRNVIRQEKIADYL